MWTRSVALIVGVASFVLWGPAETSRGGREPGTVILRTDSLWRFRTVWETPEMVLPSCEVRHARVKLKDAYPWFRKNPASGRLPDSNYTIEQVEMVRLPAETPPDWMQPGFDDSTWARLRGPMLEKSISENWKLILMRGLFEVTDPAKAGDLTLSLSFRGGAVVYLNGQEVGRAFMPKGDVTVSTSAEPYPEEVYFSSEGFALLRYDKSPDGRPRIRKRIRRLTECRIPAARLRKGVNVLAVAIHRAPTPATFYASRNKNSGALHHDAYWAKIGLFDVNLTAPAGAAIVPNTGPLKGRGFRAWNQSIIQTVYIPDYPDPFAPLSPLAVTAVRNGTFAAQVVVGDDKPIKGLKAVVSDLTGPGTIPASAVQVRYAVADGASPGRDQPPPFDSLEEFPPAEVPVYEEHGGAVQPVWITVSVPTDAKPGDYTGTVTIAAEGVERVAVPLTLRVIDWALPHHNAFTARMDIVESPESVAMAYDVPLWSDAHFRLLDKTFSLLAPLAAKTLYITCIRRTHFGNEHAMVRWVRDDAGELQPDFTIAEKYLDVAVKHLGKVPGVILYCWEPISSMGHAGGAGGASRMSDKPILISVLDPGTGNLKGRKGPAWGTREAQAFWKRLTDGIAPVFEKRGLEKSLLFGLVGDCRPTEQAMNDIAAGVPNGKWAVHSHYYCVNWQGHEMGMTNALWGIGCAPADPARGYSFGWSNPRWISYYPREMSLRSTLVEHRVKLESWLGARRAYTPFIAKGMGPRGLGRLGADFWVVLKDSRGSLRSSLAGRYPESYWGQLNLNYGIPYLLGKGTNGPVATVRSEAFRENIQEVEARIYIEKALLDDRAETLLGEDLVARCRTALDERIRMCLHAAGEGQPWFISADWSNRTKMLFSLAAEVSRRLGGRRPIPNLKPEADAKK